MAIACHSSTEPGSCSWLPYGCAGSSRLKVRSGLHRGNRLQAGLISVECMVGQFFSEEFTPANLSSQSTHLSVPATYGAHLGIEATELVVGSGKT